MKKLVSSLIFTAFLSAQAEDPATKHAVPEKTEESKAWALTLETGVYSHYIFRGLTYNHDPVVQTSATLDYKLGKEGEYGKLSLCYWNSVDTTNIIGQSGEITENDYGICWSHEIGGEGDNRLGDLKIGNWYYDFNTFTPNHTSEVYFDWTFNSFLSPEITAYYDYQEAHGWYLNFAIGHEFGLDFSDLTKEWKLALTSNVGWTDGNSTQQWYGEKDQDASFTDFNVKAQVKIPVSFLSGDKVTTTFKPFIQWFTTLDRVHQNAAPGDQEGFVGGATLSFEF